MFDFSLLPEVAIRQTDDEIALLTELREELEALDDVAGARDCYRLIASLSGAREQPAGERLFRIPEFHPKESLADIWQDLAEPTRGKLEAARAIAVEFEFYVAYEGNAVAALIRSATEEEFAVRGQSLRAANRKRFAATAAMLYDLIDLAVSHLKALGRPLEAVELAKAHVVRIVGNAALHPLGTFGSEQLKALLRSASFVDRDPARLTFWHILSDLDAK